MACENCVRPDRSASAEENSAQPTWPEVDVDCPSCLASQWQGNDRYPGVDEWTNTIIPKGEVLYYLGPTSSGFFTSVEAVAAAGSDADTLRFGLQIAPNGPSEQRPLIAAEIPSHIRAARGLARANPQYGQGGLPQYYIPGYAGNLIPPQQRHVA